MALIFITVLFLITLYLMICSHLRAARILFGITIIVFLLIGTGVIPYFMLKSLQASESISKPDFGKNTAIILLGFGIMKQPESERVYPMPLSYSRITNAAMLYNSCKKSKGECKIVISGGDPNEIGRSEANVYKEILIQLNINLNDILVEEKSDNTFQNAKLTNELLKKYSFDKLYLVTSAFHLKRSELYFSHFGLNTIAYPADYLIAPLSIIPKSYNFMLTDLAIHEYLGFLRYYIYNYFNLNK